ncbi:phosphatidylinositol 4-phosphate 3-kinase C2 domain-containing subunit alpha-like isoform X1 [Clavelina lepadiformis]|uniref:phosphatidylinositol 4-phosphate 3-kinase C2 domain-containing subunit alpha-like isoform X1 n=1 Tax=Clavelina lepadiformis TaxID=159417 RepID=UPI004043146D
MQKTTDIRTALQMEEEALKKMKKAKALHKPSGSQQYSGILNPNCMEQHAVDKKSKETISVKKNDTPDLMSFGDVSSASLDKDWDVFETKSCSSNNTAYSYSVTNVLSLYNMSGSMDGTFAQQRRSHSPSPGYQWVQPDKSHQANSFAPSKPLSYQSYSHANYPTLSGNALTHRTSLQSNFSTPSFNTQANSVSNFSRKTSHTLPTHFDRRNEVKDFPKRNSISSRDQQNFNRFDTHFNKNSKNGFENDFAQLSTGIPRPSSLGQLQAAANNTAAFQISPTSPYHVKTDFGFLQLPDQKNDNTTLHSSAGSTSQDLSATEPQLDDKLTSIFDEWLHDGLSSNEAQSSPVAEDIILKAKPDWLEWDPLSNDLSASSAISSSQVTPAMPNFQQQPIQAEKAAVNESSVANVTHTDHKNEKTFYNMTTEVDESTELQKFARMVSQLRSGFKQVDHLSNPGHVVSLMAAGCHCTSHEDTDAIPNYEQDATVHISVTTDGISQPVTFECDVNASVEHIVSQALCIAYEDITEVSADDYFFKVVGTQEYLISKTRLSMYQYVQECQKFEQDVKLELLRKDKVDRSLKRQDDDDKAKTVENEFLKLLAKPPGVLSRDEIQKLLEVFNKEEKKFLEAVKTQETENSNLFAQQQLERTIQSVKAICCGLGNIETLEISEAIKKLRASLYRPPNSPASKKKFANLIATSDEIASGATETVKLQKVTEAMETLSSVLVDLTQMYCKAYEVDALCHTISQKSTGPSMAYATSTSVKDLYSVNIISAHRLPKTWETSYNEFFATCALWHGDTQLNHKNISTRQSKVVKGFLSRVSWNTWLDFDIAVCDLPLEVVLRVILHGTIASDEKVITKRLGFVNIPLFDQDRILKHCSEIYGMWDFSKVSLKPNDTRCPMSCSNDVSNPESVALNIAFSEDMPPSMLVKHPHPTTFEPERIVNWQTMSSIPEDARTTLKKALTRAHLMPGPLCNLSQRERDLLWKHKHIIAAPNCKNETTLRLPLLLQCVPQWSPCMDHFRAAHQLLASSKLLEPEESLALLSDAFPDYTVRASAIRWIEMAGDMEISCWLPQLVQAMRCEQHLDNPLARLLLRRAMGSIRICHKLYWLLHENMSDVLNGDRFSYMHAALVTICGAAMKKEFEKETYFLKKIHRAAVAVRETKDSMKSSLLNDELTKISSIIGGKTFRVPTNPALVANGLNVKNSSYFTSNAIPLKLAFSNADVSENDINIMYKVGDDLRQDALTMQLIRVMDRMWLNDGLDLRIVTFDCLPTGPNQGMVELISDSKTFREIQSSYGLTGAFKDRPIAEWLQKYNSTGLSYERAVENFTLSCAGYCVATYVLGICDRHNDNIMLRTTGHLFHIDFARFLGHAQMFGNIKRDRAPFVLTSDMAYVINGGDRPSSKFQEFVDICCQAFNILRKQSHTIINLLSLMVDCGIPELSSKSDLKFVYDTLKPNASDTEATTMFTRLIDSSLSSSFTRLNFFIHSLAQMRFHGGESDEDRKVLSFAPQIHGFKEEEGTIVNTMVVGYQKRYSPDKYYVYCIKVTREKNTAMIDSYVFRTFDEFEELHRKLSYNSSLALPGFPSSVVVGRSQVKHVAERRKAKLNAYLGFLLKSHPKVAKHDLVYTFFHPILRDEEQDFKSTPKTPDLLVGGEIKLSLHYKNSAFYVMVQHCKNLSPVDGTDPDPYVKTYILPDPNRISKRKTKVARKTLHPTYNEMLVYQYPFEDIKLRQLQVSVWNYESFQENDFMGGAVIDLSTFDISQETSAWYPLKQTTL